MINLRYTEMSISPESTLETMRVYVFNPSFKTKISVLYSEKKESVFVSPSYMM